MNIIAVETFLFGYFPVPLLWLIEKFRDCIKEIAYENNNKILKNYYGMRSEIENLAKI